MTTKTFILELYTVLCPKYLPLPNGPSEVVKVPEGSMSDFNTCSLPNYRINYSEDQLIVPLLHFEQIHVGQSLHYMIFDIYGSLLLKIALV